VSEHYLREFDIMAQGQRNKRYVEGQHWRSSGRLGRSVLIRKNPVPFILPPEWA
jgi:hypothetical protein